jgi:light-regulated signal transduction histidine kinase (bacteriophytochrome)
MPPTKSTTACGWGRERWFAVKAEFERDEQGRALQGAGRHAGRDRAQAGAELRVPADLNASLEQRIQDRTRALKDAYDELESYSYAVAHDLRSPLRIINGFAQALQEDNPHLSTGGRDHLERIKAASKKMGELIDGLLKLSQYARGEVQRQPVNLSAIATRLLEELAASEPKRRWNGRSKPGPGGAGRPAAGRALLQNLLHNAWKYTAGCPEPGSGCSATAHGRRDPREYCVSDNGAGFDMARADKLFQPFQRLHQPHEFTGLGIGLATARRIVQRHGGVLRAHSAPGQGAAFSFTLGSRD